jgi:hypothetical protein
VVSVWLVCYQVHALPVHQLLVWIDSQIATLNPGCFALVMATGIISNALLVEGRRELSTYCSVPSRAVVGPNKSTSRIFVLYACRGHRRSRRWRVPARIYYNSLVFVAVCSGRLVGPHLFQFRVLIFLNTGGANVVHGGWLLAIVGTDSLVILGASHPRRETLAHRYLF